MVQNCPNLLSDATLNPFGSVVIRVSLGPIADCAYWTGGNSFNGSDNGGYGVTICSDNGFLVEKYLCVPFAKFLHISLCLCGSNVVNNL